MLQQLNTILACLNQPAFVRDETGICLVNAAAARLGLCVGTAQVPAELPAVGSDGCSVSCSVGGLSWQAQVRPLEQWQLVILEPVEACDAALVGAAARAMREPLQQLSVMTAKLWPYLEEQEDEQIQQGTASISRGIHRMLRAVWNLSELALPESAGLIRKKRVECRAFLEGLAAKVQPLVESTGRRLELICQNRRFYALMDAELIERALLNLLVNAVQHTPEGGCITLRGMAQQKRCCFTVENEGKVISEAELSGLFDTYRHPDLALQSAGAGIGLAVVRKAAQTHGGSLLAQPNPGGGLQLILSVEMAEITFGEDTVCSPVQVTWNGGYDRCMTEFADVLEDRWFDSRALD